MSPGAHASAAPRAPRRAVVVGVLGVTQILAWGSSYYLPAVLAGPVAAETGWPLTAVVACLSGALLAAGLVAPRVGRAIDAAGGRPVLALSSLLLAVGLAALSIAPTLPAFALAWIVIGLGMGAGLYDAAFATLGRLYGAEARPAITLLTLYGGFASTLGWPLSAALVEAFGWRGACLAYAAIHLGLTLPLHALALPGSGTPRSGGWRALLGARAPAPPAGDATPDRRLLLLLATQLTIGGIASATLSVHLLTVLQARDIALAGAVALGALVGPSQVAARVVEMLAGRRLHPLWTTLASSGAILAGLLALALGLPGIAAGLVLYGAGIGVRSIVRGTLPLALFGSAGYATLIGRLAAPNLLVGALAPLAGAVVLDHAGPGALLWGLVAFAALDTALVGVLIRRVRPGRREEPGPS